MTAAPERGDGTATHAAPGTDADGTASPTLGDRLRHVAHMTALWGERGWDWLRDRLDRGAPPADFRIVCYLGHGTADEVVVRGRVLDDPEPPEAVEGERVWAAMRRMAARFESDELPGVPLTITCGSATTGTTSDHEGYFDVRLRPDLGPATAGDEAGWHHATVRLAEPWRGLDPDAHAATARLRIPDPDADVAIVSDMDDTVLQTGAQRTWEMIRVTATNSALTRVPFPGVGELYRALVDGRDDGATRPVFYVSSSPWNLYGFLTAFLEHRRIPLGPLLLRDLGISESKFIKSSHGEHKLTRIREVLDLHPDLDVVLVGDSGQHDPQIYAEVVATHPGRVRAVWIREVRLDPGDGRVEAVAQRFGEADVPMVLAADSVAFAEHAVELGLLDPVRAEDVARAVAAAARDGA